VTNVMLLQDMCSVLTTFHALCAQAEGLSLSIQIWVWRYSIQWSTVLWHVFR